MSGFGQTSGQSGVAWTKFTQRKIIEHAARRAKRVPQKLSSEDLVVASDLLLTLTSQWVASGFPLWTRQYQFMPVPIGGTDSSASQGTVEILHAYWRVLQPYRGAAKTAAGADASVLFGGQPNADVILTGDMFVTDQNDVIQTDGNGTPLTQGAGLPPCGVIVSFGSTTMANTLGILPGIGIPFTTRPTLLGSVDGATWTVLADLPSTTFTPGVWNYVDLNPSPAAPFMQVAFGRVTSIALNQIQIGLPNGVDIPMGPLNIDDYYNLPNKLFRSPRPNSMYQDRLLEVPVLKIWPALSTEGFYAGVPTALTRRFIQDPGLLTNNIEVPQRWAEALIWRLANLLMHELPDEPTDGSAGGGQGAYFSLMAKQQLFDRIEKEAAKAEAIAWSSEVNVAPIRWMPNISVYTR